jgi:hypothetical protein
VTAWAAAALFVELPFARLPVEASPAGTSLSFERETMG